MKEKLKVVQLRGTVFLPQTVGYTPETARNFQESLLPGAKVFGVPQAPVLSMGNMVLSPQYGMPWRLFKRENADFSYNIVFLPNKIDIILEGESEYASEAERQFCTRCGEWFAQMVQILGAPTAVSRIAYAPLYALTEDQDTNIDAFWRKKINIDAYEGAPVQDRSLSYLLKREVRFGEETLQLNLLHNLFDGTKTVNSSDLNARIVLKTFMAQLDINSVPEITLCLGEDGIKAFFGSVLQITDKLVDNLFD